MPFEGVDTSMSIGAFMEDPDIAPEDTFKVFIYATIACLMNDVDEPFSRETTIAELIEKGTVKSTTAARELYIADYVDDFSVGPPVIIPDEEIQDAIDEAFEKLSGRPTVAPAEGSREWRMMRSIRDIALETHQDCCEEIVDVIRRVIALGDLPEEHVRVVIDYTLNGDQEYTREATAAFGRSIGVLIDAFNALVADSGIVFGEVAYGEAGHPYKISKRDVLMYWVKHYQRIWGLEASSDSETDDPDHEEEVPDSP